MARSTAGWTKEKRALQAERCRDPARLDKVFQTRWERGQVGKVGTHVPSPSKHATTRDLEWAAGFIEGEGSFGAHPHGGAHVQVTQVNPEPLVKLQALFGGSIGTVARTRVNPKWNDAFRWFATGSRARGIMMTLFHLLSEKRRGQIRACLGVI